MGGHVATVVLCFFTGRPCLYFAFRNPDWRTLVQLFKRLPEEEHLVLAAALVTCTYPKGAILMKQGAAGDEFFIIMTGKVAVSIDGNKARTTDHGSL